MCAKKSRKTAAAPVPNTPASAAAGAAAAVLPARVDPPPPSWFESDDPRKRLIAQIAVIGVWVYLAALWLLALDQIFNWGLFGPGVAPVS